MIYPSLKKMSNLAVSYNRIPVYKELNISEPGLLMLLKSLQSKRELIFLESARQDKKISRFSYLGFNPKKAVHFNPPHTIEKKDGIDVVSKRDIFEYLKEELGKYSSPTFKQFGTFNGGLVGYMGFEMVNYSGILRKPVKEDSSMPLAIFLEIDDFICYDNKLERYFIATALYPDNSSSLESKYLQAVEYLDELEADIISRITKTSLPYIPSHAEETALSFRESYDEFTSRVRDVKKMIYEGEAIQVVMSMRADIEYAVDPYIFYLRLRQLNPSPYMFYLKFDRLVVVGSSPEIHVKVDENKVVLKPIAGTIAQGKTKNENRRNKEKLSNDPKERAEHLMLVDLARNDLARIALPDSVKVHDFMVPEDYSHVIHLVTTVTAELGSGYDAIDVLRETFPAGTVSGAPKVRALEIINQFESYARGVYAGAIGYFGYNKQTDTCITIRTAYFTPQGNYIQAGAGIVFDSDPDSEYHEICHKLKALSASLPYARIHNKEAASNVLHD